MDMNKEETIKAIIQILDKADVNESWAMAKREAEEIYTKYIAPRDKAIRVLSQKILDYLDRTEDLDGKISASIDAVDNALADVEIFEEGQEGASK